MKPLSLLLVCGLAIGCGSGPSSSDVELSTNVVIQLDVFSGRPNPAWVPTESEADQLADRLSGLPPAEGASLPMFVLGYRGFVVRAAGGKEIRVWRGYVAIGSRLYHDAGGAEHFLIQSATVRGYGALIDR